LRSVGGSTPERQSKKSRDAEARHDERPHDRASAYPQWAFTIALPDFAMLRNPSSLEIPAFQQLEVHGKSSHAVYSARP
jgi:hypothetical protein